MGDDSPDSSVDSLVPDQRVRWFFDPRATGGRVLVATILGGLSLLLTPADLSWRIRAVAGWDTSALTFLVLAWMTIARANAEETRRRAALEDPGRLLVFVVAIGSSLVSLFAAVAVIRQIHHAHPDHDEMWIGLALGAIALSWMVTHTAFTLRYAHLYYRKKGPTFCFRFPGDDPPAESDFAYFAFTIGMAFQTSDVSVCSTRARRVVMLHGLIAFVYNTTILALSLNMLAGALG